jgi:hypothetical protein
MNKLYPLWIGSSTQCRICVGAESTLHTQARKTNNALEKGNIKTNLWLGHVLGAGLACNPIVNVLCSNPHNSLHRAHISNLLTIRDREPNGAYFVLIRITLYFILVEK